MNLLEHFEYIFAATGLMFDTPEELFIIITWIECLKLNKSVLLVISFITETSVVRDVLYVLFHSIYFLLICP